MTSTVSVLMIAAASLAVRSLKRVPEGQAFTVHRFGQYRRTLDAGLHWILPLIDKVAHRVSLTGRALSVAPQTLAAERTAVTLQGRVYYQVLDVERADAEADHLDDVVLGQLLATLRRDAANLDQASDGELNATLKRDLNLELRSHGVVVTRCQLQRDAA